MSENSKNKPYYSPEQLQLIATAAIASVSPTPDMTEDQWQRAVVRRATTIQRLRFLQEGSVMMNVLSSVKIKATVISVTYEESSQRYVVQYHPVKNPQQTESIRTPRMDSYAGNIIAQDIERLKGYAGTNKQVVVFKCNEIPDEETAKAARANGQNVPAAGYRQAVWFDFID